jgi:cytochrome P450
MDKKNPEGHAEIPSGLGLTALDASFREDPYPILGKIREASPAYHDGPPDRFFVTRHSDVRKLLRDTDLFMDPRKANDGTFAKEVLAQAAGMGDAPNMLFIDDPDHRRLRSLVSAAFRPKDIEGWRESVRALINKTLDEIEENEFDLVQRFAAPVPVAIIATMLGIDENHFGKFKAWSDTVVLTGFNPFPTKEQIDSALNAKQHLDDFLLREIEARAKNLGDDLISAMLRAEDEGGRLSQKECVDQCRLLLVAGNVTTTDLICNGVKALLDHPEQFALLRENPDLVGNAVEEMLRYDPSVLNTGRVTNRGLEIGGCPVRKGESLSLSLAAANRDPEAFDNPDSFDITRKDMRHVAFGGGKHLCIGAHLARMETQEAVLALITRFPQLRYSDKGYRYHSIPSFRGMESFWVRKR